MPVYYGLPPNTYTHVGQIRIEDRDGWNLNVLKIAATEAKQYGADALIVINADGTPASAPPNSQGNPADYPGKSIQCIAIRWKNATTSSSAP